MRYIAGVHLYRGTIMGLDYLELIRDEPIKLFCLDDTLAALQTKMMARNVQASYDFTFVTEPEVRGQLTLPVQDYFLDVDLERNQSTTSILGIYLTQPDDTFTMNVAKGTTNKDMTKIEMHVKTIAKMVFSRDARTAILLELTPKIESFLVKNDMPWD